MSFGNTDPQQFFRDHRHELKAEITEKLAEHCLEPPDGVMERNASGTSAFFDRRESAEEHMLAMAAEAAVRPNVVLIAAGTPQASYRRKEALERRHLVARKGLNLHRVAGGQHAEPSTDAYAAVLWPVSPRTIFELSPENTLDDVFRQIPIGGDSGCDLPLSVSPPNDGLDPDLWEPIGGSDLCTGKATGYAVDVVVPWLIVYRCCVMCARMLFQHRWERKESSQEGGQWISAAHARQIQEQQNRRQGWNENGGPT